MYSVIIRPQNWRGEPEGLAGKLAPLLGLNQSTVSGMLSRGRLTVESSLSHDEALSLHARLESMGFPSEIVEPGGQIIAGPRASSPSDLGVDLLEADVMIEELEVGDATIESLELPELGDDIPDFSSPRATSTTPVPVEPSAEDPAAAGWGMLFPDLAQRATITPTPSHDAPREHALTPTLGATSSAGPPEAQSSSEPVSAEVPLRVSAEMFGGEPVESSPQGAPPLTAFSPSFGAEPVALEPPTSPQSLDARIVAASAVGAPAPQPASTGIRRPGRFDGERLMSAFDEDDDAPPYKPEGFDGRPPHSPFLAGALSFFAPGAGQIYNGEDNHAWYFAQRFWMIKPWIDAVRDAKQTAVKVRTYYAPAPPEGNIKRAFKFAGGWIAVVAFIVISISTVTLGVMRSTRPEPIPRNTAADVYSAMSFAKMRTLEARIASLSALQDAVEEYAAQRSELSTNERTERLFYRGVEDCRRGRYELCIEMMKRVRDADSSHKTAVDFITWAALSKSGARQEMPTIDGPQSLEEYEALLLKTEQLERELDLPTNDETPTDDPASDDPVKAAPANERVEGADGEADAPPPDSDNSDTPDD